MVPFTATFDLTMIYFVAMIVIAILVYVLVLKLRARGIRRNLSAMSSAIMDYFRENGGDVAVECITRPGGQSYIALISSKPTKRFRHSNVVEVILCDHVRKVCGLELEKVFWCFPIKAKVDASARETTVSDAPTVADTNDEYRTEGLARIQKLPGYQVTESSFEAFEATVRGEWPPADGGSVFGLVESSA